MRNSTVGGNGEINEVTSWEFQFLIGEVVYFVASEEQYPLIVREIKMMPEGLVMYNVSTDFEEKWVYEFEITREKSLV